LKKEEENFKKESINFASLFLQPSSRRKAPGLEQGLMRPLKNSYY